MMVVWSPPSRGRSIHVAASKHVVRPRGSTPSPLLQVSQSVERRFPGVQGVAQHELPDKPDVEPGPETPDL